ncbi:hypothetical protein [Verrucomicrobium spinosum]|uniref:hypothetical protein n=1 Tax=Verrucomicrobium spinosum TaxID=2736 RepID=UPI0009461960|nr:hypothetical protein [Verrucomicrobium spinosum]
MDRDESPPTYNEYPPTRPPIHRKDKVGSPGVTIWMLHRQSQVAPANMSGKTTASQNARRLALAPMPPLPLMKSMIRR